VDLSTIIGLLLGTLLVVAAIATGQNPMLFLDGPAALIVLGGTLGVTFIRNPLERVFGTLGIVRKAFFTKLPQPDALIENIVDLARTARRESLLALEKEPIRDPVLASAVQLAVDGMEPGSIRVVLETEIAALVRRHRSGQELLDGIATSAPAFGLIGTLIGLAQMLSTLDDPAKVGPGMAIALMTTLYGALLANLVALPLADKLKHRSREEVTVRTIVMEGMLSIADGDHPAAVQQRLAAHLAPRKRGRAAA
jgi:chemotaxis protein MotA